MRTHSSLTLRRTIQVLVPSMFVSAVAFSEACSTEPTAQFIAGVQSQVQVPRDLKTVLLRVKLAGSEQFCQAYNVSNGTANLPQSLGTITTQDQSLPVEIAVIGISRKTPEDIADCSAAYGAGQIGTANSDVRVLRRSRQTYVPGRKLYVPMPLRYSCYDTPCDSEDQTCKGGVCVALQAPEAYSKTLVEYRDDLFKGDTNLCFPAREQKDAKGVTTAASCFLTGLPPKVIDDATCTFEPNEVPNSPFVGVNVEASFDGGYTNEVLDLDVDDGFFIPDATKPKRFRLSDGLCKAYHHDPAVKHLISALRVSSNCVSKTILQPLCTGDEASINPPSATPSGGVGSVLAPTKSGLVFLLDTSKDNQTSFGDDGIVKKLVDVALKDPALKSIDFGLITVPGATPTQCATAATAFDLLPVADQKNGLTDLSAKISTFVGTANVNNLRSVDANVKLGLNISELLAATKLNELKTANVTDRNAIVFVGNGPYTSSCDAGTAAKTEAANALTKGIKTYVVQTDVGYPQDAADFATAGGTTAYNASGNGSAKALEAFAEVSASLTTCRYEEPLVNGVADATNNAPVEYFDPISLKSVTVAHSDSCSEASGAGWTRQGGKIVMCKDSCDALRETYKKNLGIAALSGLSPSALPIFLRAPKK